MRTTRALIVGSSCVERSFLQSTLEPIAGLKVAYSLRAGQRVLERLSTGDIDVLFLVMSPGHDPEQEFLEQLASVLCSEILIVPVCTVAKPECLSRLREANIRCSYYYTMPTQDSETEKFREEIAKTLSRRNGRKTLQAPAERPETAELVCIVASTGGPDALSELLSRLDPKFSLPILITQHMPTGFVDTLCENLSRQSGRPVERARDGLLVERGRVYIAPGHAHLCVRRRNNEFVCVLDDSPPSAGCKPSGNLMLASAAEASAGRMIGVCLTGMGDDGCDGMGEVVARGGRTIVQDEASSVVWGMPGAIVKKGYGQSILPLCDIAAKIAQLSILRVRVNVRRAS